MSKVIWKPIEGYEEFYKISNFGEVKSLRRNRLLKIHPDTSGYLQAVLYKDGTRRTFKIHRLVGKHFIENPKNLPEINHLDGVKSNNHVSNLE